jgi:chemotaxis response regulator CheB
MKHSAPELLVIGCSAGGVEALGILLAALPPGCSVPVAVVLHQSVSSSPNGSRLDLVFGGRCPYRIKEIEDKEPIENSTVYFAPPGIMRWSKEIGLFRFQSTSPFFIPAPPSTCFLSPPRSVTVHHSRA